MNNKNMHSRVMWGVALIAAAFLILADGLGYLGNVDIGIILLTVLWGVIGIDGIVKIRVPQVLFSLAFLAIVWSKVLGLEKITPWPVLGAAALCSIGYVLIFGKRRFKDKFIKINGKNSFGGTVDMDDSEVVNCSSSFGETVKYINSQNLKEVNIYNSFSGTSVYFDKAAVPDKKVIVNISNDFGGVELYVPSSWNVDNQVKCAFAGVDEQGRRNVNVMEEPVTLIMRGNTNFGGITIKYI